MSAAGAPALRVAVVDDYAAALPALRAVREAVFVEEQGVPVAIELDAADPLCRHVLATADGAAVGTGRLTPDQRIGRMAVLPAWRDRGVGAALLAALVDEARRLGWREVSLHAQVRAQRFYARHGFLPVGARFVEAGLEHQAMRRSLVGPSAVESREAAVAAVLGIVGHARRELAVYTRDLDPGLFDQADVVAALRRYAVQGGRTRVLLQDPAAPQRAVAPLLGLAQRLPTAFEFRAVEDPADRAFPAAYAVSDRGGWLYRPLGHRFDGETRLDGAARARQLTATFEPVWQRARPATELRALGL